MERLARNVVEFPPIRFVLASVARALDYARNRQRYAGYRRRYDIDETFRFQGELTKLSGDGTIAIGPGGHIGGFCKIDCVAGTRVSIGADCAIGSNVRIYTANPDSARDLTDPEDDRVTRGGVAIGRGVWLADNVLVTEGVTIGDGAVIGANAVVTEDVPAGAVAVGVPARVVKEDG